MKCRVCGCTEEDCSGCIARTGEPCRWAAPELCSACVCRWREIAGPIVQFENQYGDRVVKHGERWTVWWSVQGTATGGVTPVRTHKTKKHRTWRERLWAELFIADFRHRGGAPV